jgi:8-oxo-dGTP pyrophosphatase MutT (NUDIX family)
VRTNFRVTGLVIQNNKVLLVHRFKHGKEYWVFPGGGVEEGETWEEALHREMLEETGLKLTGYAYLYESSENPGCIFYTCELEPGTPVLGGPEAEEQSPENRHILEWVELENLLKMKDIFPKPEKILFESGLSDGR